MQADGHKWTQISFYSGCLVIPAAVDVDSSVMAGLVPAIYDFHSRNKDMDGQDKPGHDVIESNITRNLKGLWYYQTTRAKRNLRPFVSICLHLRSNSFFTSTDTVPNDPMTRITGQGRKTVVTILRLD